MAIYKNLSQLLIDLEQGYINNHYLGEDMHTTVKCGYFDNFSQFLSYFERTYKPALQRLEERKATKDDARALSLLASDLIQMFSDNDDDNTNI